MSLARKLNSVRFKLIVVPLLLLSLAIAALAVATFGLVRRNMILGMQQLGFELVEQAVLRIADNNEALAAVEDLLEEKLLTAARIAVSNPEAMTSENLTKMAGDVDVDAIHWYNADLEIVASAFDLYLGWVATPDHPVSRFASSNQSYLVEEIRKDTESDNYYKYAYMRGPQGELVQVGVLANTVQALTDRYSNQLLVEELASNEGVVFAALMDRERRVFAHSNHDRIGAVLTDEGSYAAAVRGENYASEYYYAAGDVTVYDVIVPVFLGGEHAGALNIGLSMADVQGSVRQILMRIVGIGAVSFVILGAVLLSISLGIVKSLDAAKSHLSLLADGDFSQEIPAKFLQRRDEFGEVAQAVEHTQTSMKNVLNELTKASLQIAGTSQQLSASTEETSASIEEVASTSNQFAATVEQMNTNSQVMVKSANQILDSTQSGSQGVADAIASTEELKEAMREIASTVEGLGRQSREIGEIVEVITGIADQTNLLALNAAIEAARAGEHGRGFAVVADEVRNLAEQSANSTTRIISLIQSIQAETERTIAGIEQGVERAEANARIVGQTGNLMQEIIDSVTGIITQIEEISRGILEINSGSHEMAATTEEQSASIDSIAASAQELSNMAEHLQNLVAQFKLS
ncbi:MAG: methyl-accepting chemotaxis protein [Limnochordia bacterium]